MDDSDTIPWITENNGVIDISKDDLKSVLKLAGQKQTEIFVKYSKLKQELKDGI